MSNDCKIVKCPLDGPFFKEWTENLDRTLTRIEKKVDKQNGRVRKLEIKWGYIAALGSILVVAIPLILKFLF